MNIANRSLEREGDAGGSAGDLELLQCPLCESSQLKNELVIAGFPVQSCDACRLRFLNPLPAISDRVTLHDANRFLAHRMPRGEERISALKRATAALYLDMLAAYSNCVGGRLLEIGCGEGELLVEAQQRGFDVIGVDHSAHAVTTAGSRLAEGPGRVLWGEIETVDLPEASFDVCVLSDMIEHVRDPRMFLQRIHRLLKPEGILFVATPSLDSWSARLMGKWWMEYRPEHALYFDRSTIQNLLFTTHFNRVLLQSNTKVLSPRYICAQLDSLQVPFLAPVSRLALRAVPAVLLDRQFRFAPGGVVAMARKQEPAPRRKLSVIVPVFNERQTFKQMMEQLIRKEIEGLDIEIVVVESNSTDGTREEALRYEIHPRVTLLLEDEPRGKGHAVRTGFKHATGDFILIQDADLEYDMNDYEDLLAPLLAGRAAFVLGSRHGYNGTWKMRRFTDQPALALTLNIGHIFFTSLLNTLYGQRLKDPFTMYKVFRRDCLFGLKFECNRFDFDHELVIKLLRKKYTPIELPVNYTSRSFSEGKKVSLFRDPLTWLRALTKFRVQSLRLAENAREANLAE